MHPKRELWFFAVSIAEFFQFQPSWYREAEVATPVLEFYVLLRSILRTKPHLRQCLTRCRHCRIFLLTHPRNADRRDLGRPFGESTRRNVAFYRAEQPNLEGLTRTKSVRPNSRWLTMLADGATPIFCGFDVDPTGDTMAQAMIALHPTVQQRLRPSHHYWSDTLRSVR